MILKSKTDWNNSIYVRKTAEKCKNDTTVKRLPWKVFAVKVKYAFTFITKSPKLTTIPLAMSNVIWFNDFCVFILISIPGIIKITTNSSLKTCTFDESCNHRYFWHHQLPLYFWFSPGKTAFSALVFHLSPIYQILLRLFEIYSCSILLLASDLLLDEHKGFSFSGILCFVHLDSAL